MKKLLLFLLIFLIPLGVEAHKIKSPFGINGGIFDVPALAPNGTAALPAFSFSGDPNTGLFWISSDTFGFATGGTLRVTVDTANITSTLPILAPDGTRLLPAYSFSGKPAMGMYRAVDAIRMAIDGVVYFSLSKNIAFAIDDSLYFGWSTDVEASNADTRLYRDAAGIIGQRNDANAQEYRIFNTDVAADDEFASIGWQNTTNVFTIQTEKLASGVVRPIAIVGEVSLSGVSSDGTGKALCVKADGNVGTCTDAVGAGGTCTCS